MRDSIIPGTLRDLFASVDQYSPDEPRRTIKAALRRAEESDWQEGAARARRLYELRLKGSR